MIKLRVEWHRQCNGCGTELITDYFGDSSEHITCPWCGTVCQTDKRASNNKLKQYVEGAVAKFEEEANNDLSAGN